MRGPRHDLRLMAQLATLSGDDLRAGWRTALANLARAASELGTPLEGLDPTALLASVSRAEQAGLLNDLSWLSAPAAATALYHIATAMPDSRERERIEEMVAQRLSTGDAATFVALATALAQSPEAHLESDQARAQVALCLALPLGAQTRTDALALSLISRPDLARRWLETPSQGALPARRLAARILEQAARAAARRHGRGDCSGVGLFETQAVRTVFRRLLDDRESLVWKHAASARGLLSGAAPTLADEIERSLDPVLSATEWRRGAASLAARIAVAPREAAASCLSLLEGEVGKQDPGIAAAMLLGMPRAAEVEPRAVDSLLIPLLRAGGVYATEAFVDLMMEGLGQGFGEDAKLLARRGLAAQLSKSGGDEGQRTLMEALLRRLESDGSAIESSVQAAMYAFAAYGTAQAAPLAEQALRRAEGASERALRANLEHAEGRREALLALMELEHGVLQSSSLADLLRSTPHPAERLGALERIHDRLSDWLGTLGIHEGELRHPTLQMRAVRALLHMVDTEGYEERRQQNRERRMRTVRGLLRAVSAEQPTTLRRALLAASARGCDALVRDRSFELSDVTLAAMTHLREPHEIQTLAEASMMAELEACLFAASELTRRAAAAPDTPVGRREAVHALHALVHALPAGHSPRTSTLRHTLLRVQLCLEQLLLAESLLELVLDDGTTLVDDLVHSLQVLAQLVGGARLRVEPEAQLAVPELGHAVQRLVDAIEEAVQQRDPGQLRPPLAQLRTCCERELPGPLHTAVSRALGTLPTLPLTARGRGASSMARLPRVTVASDVPGPPDLPHWLPPNRTLGSFYVLHSIGEGGGGSVFVAKRSEDRSNASAELFALKVPDYDGDAARALSEHDFLQMFREEAGALLAMPQDQPNLARFVTFDAGVRPKPILVMEYVEGPSLERLLARRHLDLAGAFDALLGIGRGLSVMHAMGVAHLDVKPSNVILRNFWSGAGLEPVLVDFGMSGRRLRPGCCTANYGAPEIWDHTEDLDPRPADIYAFGCLTYEVLTGRRLFEAPSDMAMISAHMLHDGMPPGVDALYEQLSLRPLAEWLTSCLRRTPANRVDIHAALKQLAALKGELGRGRWPLRAQQRKRVQQV